MMHQIRAAIVEDQQANVEILLDLLTRYCPDIEVIGYAGKIDTAVELLSQQRPEIVFLDVELSDGDSFEILEKLPNLQSQLIFITAHNHYAMHAIKKSALDYLLKPIVISELKTAVAKAMQRIKAGIIDTNLAEIAESPAVVDTRPNTSSEGTGALIESGLLAVPVLNGFEVLKLVDIVRVSAERSYSTIHLSDGTSKLVSRPIAEYERILLEKDFYRVHKTHLVNLRHIRRYIRGRGGQLIMSDGSTVNVAARKRDAFLEIFDQF